MAESRDSTEEKKNVSIFTKVLWGIAGVVGVATVVTGVTMAVRVAMNAKEKLQIESKKKLTLVVVNNTKNLDISKITTGIVDAGSSDENTNVRNSVLVRTTTNHIQSRVDHNKNTGDLVVIIFYFNGQKDQFRIESIFSNYYRFEFIMKTNDIDFIRKSKTTFQITIRNPEPEEKGHSRENPDSTSDVIDPGNVELAIKYNDEGKLLLDQAFQTELDEDKTLEAKNLFYEAMLKFEKALALNPIQEYSDHIRLIGIKLDGNASINDAKQLEEMAEKKKNLSDDSDLISTRHALEKYNEAKEKFVEGLKNDKRFVSSLQLVDKAIEQLNHNISTYSKIT